MAEDADASDPAPGNDPSIRSRAEVLALLDSALVESHRKATSGRVYDAETEQVRQGWFRVLGYLAGQYRQLKNDDDLAEMEERLDELEARLGESSAGDRFRVK